MTAYTHSLLVDPHGRPLRATAWNEYSPGWDPNSRGRRTAAWTVPHTSINSLITDNMGTLVPRTRDTVRRNGWADAGVRSWAASLVGNGIVPRPVMRGEDEAELREQIVEAWEDFVDECDADGTMSFYGMQTVIARSLKESGEVFIRFRDRRPEDGLGVPLQLQLIESDLCDHAKNETVGSRRIKAGIEFDSIGRRRAYWMYREHPGEQVQFRVDSTASVPVPATQIMHVFQTYRPGQIRGFPQIAAVVAHLHELDKMNDATVVKQQIGAMFAGFITKPATDLNPIGSGSEGTDEDEIPIASLEVGTMQELLPGEEITFSNPPAQGDAYLDFMRTQLRLVATGMGVTYEQLTQDYEGVTFSSVRAALIEFRRQIEQVQKQIMVFQFCRPVWRRFLEAAILAGRVSLPNKGVTRRLMRAVWTPTPGWAYVDPEKEIKAVVRAIRGGLISRAKAVSQYGFDVVELDREIESDNKRADDMGLVFDSDARVGSDGEMDPTVDEAEVAEPPEVASRAS